MTIVIVTLVTVVAVAGTYFYPNFERIDLFGEKAAEANKTIGDLKQQVAQLEERTAVLESERDSWMAEAINSNKRLNDLHADYNTLEVDYDSLQDDYYNLQVDYNALEESQSYYEELTISEFQRRQRAESALSTSATPPYTLIEGREIKWVFMDSRGNMYSWNMPIDSYRELIEYPEPEEYLTLQLDDGSIARVRDHTQFVDSNSFSEVIDQVYDNAGSDYQFLYELWYITSELTTYSTDIAEEPRWALETFTEAGGDCEDLTILLASMLKSSSHTRDWEIKMVYMDSDYPQNPRDVNHVILYVETGDFSTFVESTAKYDGLGAWTESITGWYYEL
ncbi:MAG: hypothetical protein HRF40_08405 [Nitrososphaera sp.]